MEEGTPLVVSRKFQKFEIKNENDSQREKAVIQDFRMEIEGKTKGMY